MTILFAILAFLVGLVVSHHYVVLPLWETEAKLRQELRTLRGELYVAKHSRPHGDGIYFNHHKATFVDPKFTAGPQAFDVKKFNQLWADTVNKGIFAHLMREFTPEGRIPHRDHSDVLFIPHPEDLLK